MFTEQNLRKFIRTRNNSRHNSNMQFSIDLRACGISAIDLGDAERIEGGYQWRTAHGKLKEVNGRMSLCK